MMSSTTATRHARAPGIPIRMKGPTVSLLLFSLDSHAPSIPSRPSILRGSELEADSQAYLTFAAPEVARAVTDRECAAERPAVHVRVWIPPPRVVEQVESLHPEFSALAARADRERPEERKVDIPVTGPAELIP